MKSPYRYEFAAARLELKEHFLQYAARGVYDNIGQLLSLVRVNLTLVKKNPCSGQSIILLDSTGETVGHIIRELRRMTAFYLPESILSEKKKWLLAFERLLHSRLPGVIFKATPSSGYLYWLSDDQTLILFSVLLKLIPDHKQLPERFTTDPKLVIEPRKLIFSIFAPAAESKSRVFKDSGLKKRVRMLDGKLSYKNVGKNKHVLILEIPLSHKP